MDLADEYWDRWFDKRTRPILGDIDDVFKEIEETLKRQFEDFSKMAPKDLVRERTLPDGSKTREWGPFVYGYSVIIGSDGKPQIREFGNMKPRNRLGRPKIDIKEQREPLVDMIETNGEVKVVVELPGVEKEDIKLHGTENTLTISVDTPQRKYYKEVRLPAKVETKKTMKASYKNGVLEVILEKKESGFKGEPMML